MKKTLGLLITFAFIFTSYFANAEGFKIGLTQDQSGDSAKYKTIVSYLEKHGVQTTLITAPDYSAMAKMFSEGKVDAMFGGSGVAGALLIKGIATPLVRPVSKDGFSTYWAVVIGKKGSPKFTGDAKYFEGKKVYFTGLASSGELFFRSLKDSANVKAVLTKSASHGASLDALKWGLADYAIVKNRVWDKSQSKYPEFEKLGEDKGENPDNTFMISKKAPAEVGEKISKLLLNIKGDGSPEAKAVLDAMGANGFIQTTTNDFAHNKGLLEKAGVTQSFEFKF